MSVTIEGIKGYEYQYKITVLFALIYGDRFSNQLYVEKLGSEDITFIDGNNDRIEIQIKREKKELTISKLFEWLFHFQERSSSNNLLLRVKNKTSRCLFITRSRCNDETLKYLNDFPSIQIKNKKSSNEELNKITKSLKELVFKNTKLDKERSNFRDKFIRNLNKSDVEQFINNIMVWEQLDDNKVDDTILNTLNKKYSISQSNTEYVYLKLLENVKEGRDKKNNIIPIFNELIDKEKVNKFQLDVNYIERKEKNNSLELLKNSNFIFLTGVSQCGKSELAKVLANHFIDNGFNSIRVTEFIQLENFFNQNSNEDKIAIFEDPFGHTKPSNESMNIKNKLIDLIRSLPLNHKLIVTNRIEIINEFFENSIFEINKTINLTESDSDVLINFWKKFASKRLTPIIVNSISEFIENEKVDKIQVGQLSYLSKYDSDKLENKSIIELINIARHNSKDIANDILQFKKEESVLLGILSVCCSNTLAINEIDFAYILSKDQEEYSIFINNRYKNFFDKKSEFPVYSIKHKIKKDYIKALEYFEERGFLKIKNKTIIFSHPNYYEVGRNLFYRKSTLSQKTLINALKKVLGCTNYENSLHACKQLYSIYSNIKNDFKIDVKELMFLTTKSIFPSVENYSTVNLIKIIDTLTTEEKEELINIINYGDTDSGSIKWYKDKIPYITKGLRTLADGLFLPNNEIIHKVEDLISNKKEVNLYDAWLYVHYHKIMLLSENYFKLNETIIKSFLLYDEVFIRKQIAKIFFSTLIKDEEEYLIKKIFDDEHPTVVFYAIWGSFLSWNKQNGNVKKIIFTHLKDLFTKSEISIRACDLMSTFSIDYAGECIDWKNFTEEEKLELWNVWGELYPTFSSSLPPSVYFNSGRFGNSMRKAMKYLTLQNGVNVFYAWYFQIDKKIKHKIDLTDYEIGILDDLIDFTKDNFQVRQELFIKIITYENSFFSLYNLKNIITYWDNLSSYEKGVLQEIIKSDRKDNRWVRALLITKDIPKEIESLIVGDLDLSSLNPEIFFKKIPTALIRDALSIIYSEMNELEYLITYLNDFWLKIIDYILINQIEPFFEICVKEFIHANVFGNRTDNFYVWKKICSKYNDLDKLLYFVIYNISRGVIIINGTKSLFDILINAYKERNKFDDFIRIIVTNIEALQLRDKEDIFEYLGKEIIFDELYKEIYPDFFAINILENTNITLIDSLVGEVDSFRFYVTYELIKYYIKKEKDIDIELKERILSIPNKIEETGKTQRIELKNKFFIEKRITNWID
ncbi:hypothetical protein LXD69_15185 [Flavobacterium sediminilitoris]|uniref:Novel STAND NTPase 3 domain-containing protein n=1 Tax=Flavobacterium sediminilitoris TaxID=2024526 RepID=A0ABY4HKK3_9FLAO|nr:MULTISPECIES: hypothetical protein [Flavobacterium]UOX33373.1 hypothetical protein LXD69_15185 [Flavobacterium sediminilitoris]